MDEIINVKIIDTQNREQVFTKYQVNTLEEASKKFKRVYNFEIDGFEFWQNELKIYCYIKGE